MWLSTHPKVTLGAAGALLAGAIAGISALVRDDR
jgi:hypothetical protein